MLRAASQQERLEEVPPRARRLFSVTTIFSLFAPQGAAISELRFRVDGPNGFDFSAAVDLEVHLSTSSQNPNQLSPVLANNVGPNETIALPRSIITIGSQVVSVGPNAFSVAIPLPNQFIYKPAEGNLLMDLFVYGIDAPRGFPNLDWQGGNSDGVSAAVEPLVPGTTIVSAGGLVTQFTLTPIPEPSATLLVLIAVIAIAGKKYVSS